MTKSAAQWIGYPSDFETMLVNRLNMQRRDRELIMPPIWHMQSVFPCVKFARVFTLSRRDTLRIAADGAYNVELDVPGNYLHGDTSQISLEAGEHSLTVTVFNEKALPCLFVEGKEIVSDGSWMCTAFDGSWVQAAESGFASLKRSPNSFRFKTKKTGYFSKSLHKGGVLYDFGKEIFGRLRFDGARGGGEIRIFYGESEEEALDTKYCETLDTLCLRKSGRVSAPDARGFRFAFVCARGAEYEDVCCLSEYAPLYDKARFVCGDALLDRIWEVSRDTLQLTSRECFIDGVKRDRWVWMGDAAQSILMDWYCFYDTEIVKRTLTAFGGKGAVTQYMNTVNDYTLYWFESVRVYFEHTGDAAFIARIYPRALAHIGFCESRLDENGMMVGRQGDWVFVDWYDGLDKEGEVCFLQILLWQAYRAVACFARLLNDPAQAEKYEGRAAELKDKINRAFWDESAGAFVWSERDRRVFRQPNVMAVFTGFADERREQGILKILLGDEIPAVKTPYMRFYELAALAQLGERERVVREIKAYWGGMLARGATSFWEYYDPAEEGAAALSMYGRKYGKSLCHAWGAAPLYLLGRYVLGLEFDVARKNRYVLRPDFRLLGEFSVRLPVLGGELIAACEGKTFRIQCTGLDGKIVLPDEKEYFLERGETLLIDL